MRVLITGLVLVPLVAAPAVAASTWTPVTGNVADAPATVTADGGSVLLGSEGRRLVSVTTIRRHRVVGRQVISRGLDLGDISVLRRPDGAAVTFWEQMGWIYSSFRRTAGRTFGARRAIPSYPSGTARVPRVAMAPDGTVVAAWWGGATGGPTGIQAAQLRADGTWTTPVDVSAGMYPQGSLLSNTVDLSIAAGRDGRFAVLWRQPTGGAPGFPTMVEAVRAADGTWSAPATLGTGDVTTVVGDLSVALPSGAGPVAVWSEASARTSDGVVESDCVTVAVAQPTGPPATTRVRCASKSLSRWMHLVTAADGSVHLAWAAQSFPPSSPLKASVWTARFDPGAATWGAPVQRVSDAAGDNDLDGFSLTTGGRLLLLTELAAGRSASQTGRITVQVLGADGRLRARIVRPAPRNHLDQTILPLPGRPEAVLVSPGTAVGNSNRAFLLHLPG